MLYEIIELANGEVVLQREGGPAGEPLIVMRFSEELMHYFKEAKIDIAKTMIEAGLEHVAKLADEHSEKIGLSTKISEPIVERQTEDQEQMSGDLGLDDAELDRVELNDLEAKSVEETSLDGDSPEEKEKNHLVH